MKHCHISILCNELPFLKEKLPFLYKYFDQIIFVDYDIVNKCNSHDGSIEYIEKFPDKKDKIILIKDFNPKLIHKYNGVSVIEKRKMFAKASEYVSDDIDIVWATDLDEFFEEELIDEVEKLMNNDINLRSINLPHKIFVYNQYNYYDKDDFYISARITRHIKNFIYGHCNFQTYGKTIKYNKRYLYHYAFIGYNRCYFKLNKIYKNASLNTNKWLEIYLTALHSNKKYIKLIHTNTNLNLYSSPYKGNHPNYLRVNKMCKELNKLQ